MITLMVVDDCQPVRDSLTVWLGLEPDFEVVAQAADGATAVELAMKLCPDVVLMDLRMPVHDGVTATARLREACPQTKVLMLTLADDADSARAAFEAGAAGYVLKYADPNTITAGIRSVHGLADPAVSEGVGTQPS